MTETSTTRALVEIRGLVKAFGVLPVLRQFDLTIEKGEFVALLGPNGSGKSTLIRLLSGLSKPTAGTIHIGGWELPQEAAAVRAQIGLVSHRPLLYENLSARENLVFFSRLYNLPKSTADARIDDLLVRVGLGRRTGDLVRTFSRGMQQRLSIARALLHSPAVLLFDEPYTGLDQDASAILDELLVDTHASGQTIIMVTHQLGQAAKLASRVVILSKGRIGYDAPTDGLDALQLASIYTQTTSMVTAKQ
ncbi:MAG: heme ABC exporter ATP-binding protein CcmA [Anaerolineaceae bacterium]|nr:heme ABC exporter ATP-binding protein CcmA [Anaerolineaceae bacterium]